jgi:hypothetical protein
MPRRCSERGYNFGAAASVIADLRTARPLHARTTMKRNSAFILALTTSGLLLEACGLPPNDAPDQVGEEQQSILNGFGPLGSDRTANIVVVCANGSGWACTGTMYNNNSVLTAAHCFGCGGTSTAPPTAATVSLNGQNIGSSNWVQHPSLDVAMITLSSPMSIGGSTSGFQSSVYSWTADSLVGQQLQADGYAAAPTLLWMPVKAASVPDQYSIHNVPVYSTQSYQGGDSGGPTWRFWNGVPFQTGVFKGPDSMKPEVFEQWAFEVAYNAPIHIPMADPQGRGMWYVPNATHPDFTHTPLPNNWYGNTNYFNPCKGSTNKWIWKAAYDMESGYDYFYITDSYKTHSLTGNGYVWDYGLNSVLLEVKSDYSVQSNGPKWMTVQCDYGPQAAALVCHGPRCGTTRQPLPQGFSQSTAWNPCGGGAFYYYLDVDFEPGHGGVTVGGSVYTGHYPQYPVGYSAGPTTVTVQTDWAGVTSDGLRGLKARCIGW